MPTYFGCGPGSTMWNPDRPPLGANPRPFSLDPECKDCGECGGDCGCGGSCGCAGSCGGAAKGSGVPALDRAAAMGDVLKNAIPPIPGAEGHFPMGGSWRLNIGTGNLVAQVHTPAAGTFDPRPVLTYNSLSSSETEFGYGWTEMHRQRVSPVNQQTFDITKGTGPVLRYSAPTMGSPFTPPDGAKNQFAFGNGGATWKETQQDGLAIFYKSDGKVHRFQNPAGGRWTPSYDAGGRMKVILDPFSRRTTAVYDGSNKIRRIVDSGGRTTTFSVDGSLNLVKVTSPELEVTTLVYATGHKLAAWIDPLGNRTSYAYDGSNRLKRVTSPLGQHTTIVYGTNKTAITDPRGQVTTLLLTSDGNSNLRALLDPLGVRTSFTWQANRLRSVQDGRGNRTTFTYFTMPTDSRKILQIVKFPSGDQYEYAFDTDVTLPEIFA